MMKKQKKIMKPEYDECPLYYEAERKMVGFCYTKICSADYGEELECGLNRQQGYFRDFAVIFLRAGECTETMKTRL